MNIIKSIKLSEDLIIETENSPLKFNYTLAEDKCFVDISHLNILNATKIAILSSTHCFINNFAKKLFWLVKDEETKRAISILRLRNVESAVKGQNIDKRAISA